MPSKNSGFQALLFENSRSLKKVNLVALGHAANNKIMKLGSYLSQEKLPKSSPKNQISFTLESLTFMFFMISILFYIVLVLSIFQRLKLTLVELFKYSKKPLHMKFSLIKTSKCMISILQAASDSISQFFKHLSWNSSLFKPTFMCILDILSFLTF